MQFRIENCIVNSSRKEKFSWFQRMWDKLWKIERIPLYHDIKVRFTTDGSHPCMRGTLFMLNNNTAWFATETLGLMIWARATHPMALETLREVQSYQGHALVHGEAWSENNHEILNHQNPNV